MNDDFLRKITASNGVFNKVKNMTDLAGVFTPLSTVDLAVQRSLSNLNPALDAIAKSSIALNAQYFEPAKFNPIMAAFGNVTQMMNQMQYNTPVYNPITSSLLDTIRNFTAHNNDTISPLLGISKITSKLLDDIKFDTFNWRGTYPDLFIEENKIEYSTEYLKFNESLVKLMDLSIIDEDSTLMDGVAVSVNLDAKSNGMVIDHETEQIFSIANQTLVELTQETSDYVEVLDNFLSRIKKFAHKHTASVVMNVVFLFISYYFNKGMVALEAKSGQSVETIFSENEIHIKQKPVKTYKCFAIAPTGTKILILEKNRVWSKIAFDNQKGISQIGHCLTSELKESN